MDTHALRESDGGPVLGNETQGRKGDLEVAGCGGENYICCACEPGRTAAYAWTVEREDEHLLMVDYGAEHLDCCYLFSDTILIHTTLDWAIPGANLETYETFFSPSLANVSAFSSPVAVCTHVISLLSRS